MEAAAEEGGPGCSSVLLCEAACAAAAGASLWRMVGMTKLGSSWGSSFFPCLFLMTAGFSRHGC